jgi:hypothetical protein
MPSSSTIPAGFWKKSVSMDSNARLVPAAWRGHDDPGVPEEKWTNESGWVDLWAPPRGYTVYVPE